MLVESMDAIRQRHAQVKQDAEARFREEAEALQCTQGLEWPPELTVEANVPRARVPTVVLEEDVRC